ncbi:hypothetical protein NIIDMKKI_16110 [Mycobacterium kansasii]|uniref:Uncharacterized protein n=1 Tax=Mycobacterium kansasii TaxID=1768 RepID=A0A7G1I9E6_MYCKA|nr:hypothetical protein NIIDMKKI_16110 [Mycobacterium kansasii]
MGQPSSSQTFIMVAKILAAAEPGEVAFLRKVEQLGVGQAGNDVLPVGERDDVVVVAVPPTDRDRHLLEPESPVPGEHDDVGERRGQLFAAAVEQVVEKHRLELGTGQQMPVGLG